MMIVRTVWSIRTEWSKLISRNLSSIHQTNWVFIIAMASLTNYNQEYMMSWEAYNTSNQAYLMNINIFFTQREWEDRMGLKWWGREGMQWTMYSVFANPPSSQLLMVSRTEGILRGRKLPECIIFTPWPCCKLIFWNRLTIRRQSILFFPPIV